MRIAMVCPYDLEKPGGVQNQALELTERIAAHGHQVRLIAAGQPEIGPTISWPVNRSQAPVSVAPPVWAKVRKALADADLVHIHEPLIPSVGWAALTSPQPQVLTFHADPSDLVRRLYRANGRWLPKVWGSAQLVAVSPVAASALPRSRRSLQLIPNGIEVPAQVDWSAKKPQQALFVGRDETRKGLPLLLSAWSEVARAVPTARLVVVSDTNRPEQPGVRFEGKVSAGRKQELLAQSGVIVTPNLGGESFGIVLLEGMAHGCAPVASNLPAFRWVSGGTAPLFTPGDQHQLTQRLIGRLSSPEKIRPAGELAFKQSHRFAWEGVVQQYLQLYRTALSGSQQSRIKSRGGS